MTNTTQFSLAGVVCFWSLDNNSDRNILERELKALSLEKFLPESRTKFSVLKNVLEDYFDTRNTLIRPLKSRTGCTIVAEQKGDSENNYEHQLAVKFEENSKSLDFIPHFALEQNIRDTISNNYRTELNYLSAPQVAKCLVDIMSHLNGIPLRPRGGVYWIPKDKMDKWEEVIKAVEKCSSGNSIYTLTTKFDDECVKAVKAGLMQDINSEIAQITDQISSGLLKKRALASKLERMKALRNKVKNYETSLGTLMDELHNSIEDVEKKATYATLALADDDD